MVMPQRALEMWEQSSLSTFSSIVSDSPAAVFLKTSRHSGTEATKKQQCVKESFS